MSVEGLILIILVVLVILVATIFYSLFEMIVYNLKKKLDLTPQQHTTDEYTQSEDLDGLSRELSPEGYQQEGGGSMPSFPQPASWGEKPDRWSDQPSSDEPAPQQWGNRPTQWQTPHDHKMPQWGSPFMPPGSPFAPPSGQAREWRIDDVPDHGEMMGGSNDGEIRMDDDVSQPGVSPDIQQGPPQTNTMPPPPPPPQPTYDSSSQQQPQSYPGSPIPTQTQYSPGTSIPAQGQQPPGFPIPTQAQQPPMTSSEPQFDVHPPPPPAPLYQNKTDSFQPSAQSSEFDHQTPPHDTEIEQEPYPAGHADPVPKGPIVHMDDFTTGAGMDEVMHLPDAEEIHTDPNEKYTLDGQKVIKFDSPLVSIPPEKQESPMENTKEDRNTQPDPADENPPKEKEPPYKRSDTQSPGPEAMTNPQNEEPAAGNAPSTDEDEKQEEIKTETD